MDRIYRTRWVFLILVLFSCGSGTAQKSISLDPEAFENKQMQKVDAILLDVRTAEEFSERHLRGAVNMDFRSFDFNSRVGRIDKSTPVYVYCLSGDRAAAAAQILEDMGFEEVYEMNGGVSRWLAETRPVEMGNFNPNQGMTSYHCKISN